MWKWSHGERQNSHVPLEECWRNILIQREAVACTSLITDIPVMMLEAGWRRTARLRHAVVPSADKQLH